MLGNRSYTTSVFFAHQHYRQHCPRLVLGGECYSRSRSSTEHLYCTADMFQQAIKCNFFWCQSSSHALSAFVCCTQSSRVYTSGECISSYTCISCSARQLLPLVRDRSILLCRNSEKSVLQDNWEAIKALALDTTPAQQLMPSTPSHDPNQSAAQVHWRPIILHAQCRVFK